MLPLLNRKPGDKEKSPNDPPPLISKEFLDMFAAVQHGQIDGVAAAQSIYETLAFMADDVTATKITSQSTKFMELLNAGESQNLEVSQPPYAMSLSGVKLDAEKQKAIALLS